MKKSNLRSALLGTAAIAVGTVGAAELAQAQLDEIVVTATKRERSLQDIPVSVSAFSAEALELSGVTNLDTLQTSVPGFSVQTAQSSGQNTSINLRGVGTTGNNLGFEGAVGIFIDGIYRSRAGASLGDFPDVERIEILRGPQGTLFGKNTTAGAVSIITKKPKMDEYEAELRATFGNYDRTQVRGIVNFPILDGVLAGRISADYSRRDGFGVDVNNANDDINDQDRYNIRGQLLWTPTPDIEVRVIGNYFAANESCCGAVPWSDSPIVSLNNVKTAFGTAALTGALIGSGLSAGAAAFLAAAAPGGIVAADDSVRNGNFSTNDFPVSERQEDRNGQIDVTWDFAENISFFNSISYQRFDLGGTNDVDFTGLNFFNVPFAAQQVELFTEEFRFSGQLYELPFVQEVNWLFGGYYSSENLGTQANLTFGPDAAFVGPLVCGTTAACAISPGDTQYEVFTQNGKTRALYGHLDIDILDWLNLSGGARYTTEDKDGGAVFTTVNLAPGTFNPFLTAGARPFDATGDADEWIGTVAVTLNFTDEISAYTSFAHGYKSGGLNFDQLGGQAGFLPGSILGGATGTITDPTFPTELNNTYEVGVKSRFWDNRATLNVTGFHSVFKNFQVLSFTGTSFTILTAPEATTTGVEGELQVSPIEGLNIAAAYTYADAEYSAPFLLGASPLGDSRLTNAPLHSGSVRATYRHPIPNTGLIGLLHGEWAYNSRTNTSTAIPSSREQNGYSLFNARMGVNTDDDRYGLQLWCRNCGDEQYRNTVFAGLVGGEFAYITPPREWGVTLSAKY